MLILSVELDRTIKENQTFEGSNYFVFLSSVERTADSYTNFVFYQEMTKKFDRTILTTISIRFSITTTIESVKTRLCTMSCRWTRVHQLHGMIKNGRKNKVGQLESICNQHAMFIRSEQFLDSRNECSLNKIGFRPPKLNISGFKKPFLYKNSV